MRETSTSDYRVSFEDNTKKCLRFLRVREIKYLKTKFKTQQVLECDSDKLNCLKWYTRDFFLFNSLPIPLSFFLSVFTPPPISLSHSLFVCLSLPNLSFFLSLRLVLSLSLSLSLSHGCWMTWRLTFLNELMNYINLFGKCMMRWPHMIICTSFYIKDAGHFYLNLIGI